MSEERAPYGLESIGDELVASFPTMAVKAFQGECKGLKGTGKFDFEVIESESGGRVMLKMSGITFKTENKADKTYRDMVGVNAAPEGLEDADDDDGTDIV